MAIIICRARPTETVRRKGASFDPTLAAERREAMQMLYKELGIQQLRICKSLDDRTVRIFEGAPDQAMMLQQVLSASGAFDSLEFEILEDMEDVLSRSAKVQRLASSFRPPNEDEIDRMLLDE